LQGLRSINLHKELKIQFTDEKVQDAGGLLREWMHLCVKDIMSKETGIF
jgi:E3 ubiquitin-protein ligase HUWE1